MRPSAESLLALLLVLLFLKDSLWLLQPNEAVIVKRLGGRWSFGYGARTWQISHREPYLLNPFLPHQPTFRLRWDMAATAAERNTNRTLAQVPRELQLLGFFAWISWLLLVLLALGLAFLKLNGWPLLAIVGVLYANILATLAAVWRWRAALKLTASSVGMLAFEYLVCPPYAANIVRRLSALHRVPDDFLLVAQDLLMPGQLDRVHAECLARLDAALEMEDPDSAETARLQAAKPQFQQGARHG